MTSRPYVCVVRDASREYLRADGRRTPLIEEAKVFASAREAKAACTRATDHVAAVQL